MFALALYLLRTYCSLPTEGARNTRSMRPVRCAHRQIPVVERGVSEGDRKTERERREEKKGQAGRSVGFSVHCRNAAHVFFFLYVAENCCSWRRGCCSESESIFVLRTSSGRPVSTAVVGSLLSPKAGMHACAKSTCRQRVSRGRSHGAALVLFVCCCCIFMAQCGAGRGRGGRGGAGGGGEASVAMIAEGCKGTGLNRIWLCCSLDFCCMCRHWLSNRCYVLLGRTPYYLLFSCIGESFLGNAWCVFVFWYSGKLSFCKKRKRMLTSGEAF